MIGDVGLSCVFPIRVDLHNMPPAIRRSEGSGRSLPSDIPFPSVAVSASGHRVLVTSPVSVVTAIASRHAMASALNGRPAFREPFPRLTAAIAPPVVMAEVETMGW